MYNIYCKSNKSFLNIVVFCHFNYQSLIINEKLKMKQIPFLIYNLSFFIYNFIKGDNKGQNFWPLLSPLIQRTYFG